MRENNTDSVVGSAMHGYPTPTTLGWNPGNSNGDVFLAPPSPQPSTSTHLARYQRADLLQLRCSSQTHNPPRKQHVRSNGYLVQGICAGLLDQYTYIRRPHSRSPRMTVESRRTIQDGYNVQRSLIASRAYCTLVEGFSMYTVCIVPKCSAGPTADPT